jgi:negative regulator of flagellin synthesis FlgM
MKIGQPSDIPVSVSQTGASNAQKASQTASATASDSAAKSTRSAGVAVTVSTLARDLEKPEKSDAGDIDAQKVASVKASIQDGTFTVNAEAIADKLLANAQELLNRTSQ